MSRISLVPRTAVRDDAASLAELWGDVLRRADRAEQIADLELIIKDAAASPEQRLVVVECDGVLAGAVFLRLATVSPINLETCVQTIQPRVLPQFRRRGVGLSLMDAAVAFAEENGVLHMMSTVPATARDANRFMARLGLAPAATFRVAPISVVRSRLTSARPACGQRQVPRVLAARRSQKRARVGREALLLPDLSTPVAPE